MKGKILDSLTGKLIVKWIWSVNTNADLWTRMFPIRLINWITVENVKRFVFVLFKHLRKTDVNRDPSSSSPAADDTHASARVKRRHGDSPRESERRRVGTAAGESLQSTLPRATRYCWAFFSMEGKSSWEAANASMRFFTEPRTWGEAERCFF